MFFALGKLKRVDASGERLRSICDAVNGPGGTWNREGTIVSAPNLFGGLARVSAAGGTPVEITHTVNSGRSHRWPFVLPDGRHFLFVSYDSTRPSEESGVYEGSLDASAINLVSKDIASNAAYLEPGYLLLVREGKLMAHRFDLKKLQPTGEDIPLPEAVRYVSDRRIADFSAAKCSGDRWYCSAKGAQGTSRAGSRGSTRHVLLTPVGTGPKPKVERTIGSTWFARSTWFGTLQNTGISNLNH